MLYVFLKNYSSDGGLKEILFGLAILAIFAIGGFLFDKIVEFFTKK